MCKQYENQIPKFLTEELYDEDLKNFVAHLNMCKSCKEELIIQYLATEGIQRLEEGASFSLDEELKTRIHAAEHKIKINSYVDRICNHLEGIAIVVLGLAITYMVW